MGNIVWRLAQGQSRTAAPEQMPRGRCERVYSASTVSVSPSETAVILEMGSI